MGVCSRCKKNCETEHTARGKELKTCLRCRLRGRVHDKRRREASETLREREGGALACNNCHGSFASEEFDIQSSLGNVIGSSKLCRACRDRNVALDRLRRERYRADDADGYLTYCADMQREWRGRNRDHWSEWCKYNINVYLRAMQGQAKKKGYPWELENEQAKELMRQKCFFCHVEPPKGFAGIDRLDSDVGYLPSNVVPACWECNSMKNSLDPTTFVLRCAHISFMHGGPGQKDHRLFPTTEGSGYASTVTRANKKSIPCTITPEQHTLMLERRCSYCLTTPASGLDRLDNAEGYTVENTTPACSECNYMKGRLEEGDFYAKVLRVAKHFDDFERVRSIPKQMFNIKKRGTRHDIPAEYYPRMDKPYFADKGAYGRPRGVEWARYDAT